MQKNKQYIDRNKFPYLSASILIWMLFVTYYAISLKFNFHRAISDDIVFIIQLIFDCVIGFCSYQIIFNNRKKEDKQFYLIFFFSVIIGLITNESYNILINILKYSATNSTLSFLWTYPYTAFLLINLTAWCYLLHAKKTEHKINKKLNTFINFSYIQSGIIIAISLFLAKPFRDLFSNAHFSSINLINTFLELFLFGLISIVLSKTKNKPLIYIVIGYLLLISLNLAQRTSYLSGYINYKIFDAFWMISLIIIIYGYIKKLTEKKDSIEFYKKNSIHTITGAVFSVFASLLFLLFIALNLLISSLDTLKNPHNLSFYENIPAILIFSYVVSILAGKLIATYASKPFLLISNELNAITHNEMKASELRSDDIAIHEINNMHKYLIETISKLEIANQIKASFIMNMSHDFKTPASGINHMSNYIFKKMENGELKKLQKLIVDSSSELLIYIDDILEYSQLSNKQSIENLTEVNIKKVIQHLIIFLTPKIHEKNLSMNFTYQSKKKGYYTNSTLINKVLLNLISNAIKFTEDGSIDISVYDVVTQGQHYLNIAIKDTGIGIDKEFHQLIFEPFFRVESSETRYYSGVGLGLSHVKLIIKQFAGNITVTSEKNKGSTFTVSLPINKKTSENQI